ncbi:MAG: hypothetical protein EPO32_10800 [Anaerolineae bacterium]|nr:MAG: hypothetical protein EPO32_10800 [Anaerolineae bacterium]
MQTFKMDYRKRPELLLSLRNHRLLVVGLMFLFGSFLVLFDDSNSIDKRFFFSLLPLYGLVLYAAFSVVLRPDGKFIRDFSIELGDNNELTVYTNGRKSGSVRPSQVIQFRETKRGLTLHRFFATIWIPKSIKGYEEIRKAMIGNLPEEKSKPYRNPGFLVVTIFFGPLIVLAVYLGMGLATIVNIVAVWLANVVYFQMWEQTKLCLRNAPVAH